MSITVHRYYYFVRAKINLRCDKKKCFFFSGRINKNSTKN